MDRDGSQDVSKTNRKRSSYAISGLIFLLPLFGFFVTVFSVEIYLKFYPFPGIQSLLSSISNIYISTILIIGSILLLTFIVLIARLIIEPISSVIVFPFESIDPQIDGKAISDILISEMRKIYDIHEKKFGISSLDRLPLPSQETNSGIILAKEIYYLNEERNWISGSLQGIGNLGIGILTLPLRPIVTTLYMLRPIGEFGCVIQGSILKQGDEFILTAHIDKGEKVFIREISGRTDLHEMIKDLAFKIAHKLAREYKSEPGKKTKNDFKNENCQGDLKELKYFINEVMKEKGDAEKQIVDEYTEKLGKCYIKNDVDCPAVNKYFFGIEDIDDADKLKDEISNKQDSLSKKISGSLQSLGSGLSEEFLKRHFIKKLNNFIKDEESLSNIKEYEEELSVETERIRNKCSNRECTFKKDNESGIRADDLKKYLCSKYGWKWLNNAEITESGTNGKDILQLQIKKNNHNLSLSFIDNCSRAVLKNGDQEIGYFQIRKKDKDLIIYSKDCKKYHLKRQFLEDLYPKNLKRQIFANSWEDLKHLTDAKDKYNQYLLTRKKKLRDEAYESCMRVGTDKDYSILFGLSFNIGITCFEEADYEKAEKMFSRASGLNPNAIAYTGEGYALRYQTRFKEAIDAFKRAIYFDHELAYPWALLGNIYLGLGSYAYDLYDKSIACFNEAIMRDPDFQYPWLYLGINYSRKSAIPVNEGNRVNYIEIALKCIDKAEECANTHGHKKMPTIATAKAACLLQRGTDNDRKIASNILLYNLQLQKDSYNKACLLSLLDRMPEAIACLNEALGAKRITPVECLFDPDIYEDKSIYKSQKTSDRHKELKKILSEYDLEEPIISDIRRILQKESAYIRSSFEAVCDNKQEAIHLIQEVASNDLARFEQDLHFESIHNIAVITSAKSENSRFGPIIKISIDVYNTTSRKLSDIRLDVEMHGLMHNSSSSYSKSIDEIEKRWQYKNITFEARVESGAKEIIIEVTAREKTGLCNHDILKLQNIYPNGLCYDINRS
jgi:tetratricopeptide (TPR) repeat protein